ncbi:Cell wall-associated protease [Polaribacter huanghezhanensis]|uniref:S8 family peptidase n=1 Tax=Polaribacter huanghezhanensis TaxID=1354726 RepID=UPI002648470F|nr:S8 family peptidase [Polaribacter huanghezhanensis]WKD85449.1 Cell wall-associated protease [Polaribacter huanghezhanensis]
MRVFKKLYVTSVIAIALLVGCKSVSTIAVPTGTNNVVVISTKKAPLTTIQKETWGHADLATDTIPGMSVDKAYIFLKGKKGVEVVVGVVDSGIDFKHEDLSAVAWVNKKEIPNNGKDDDNNGYVDDINGWNFLGPIYKENAEVERILKNPKLVDEATYKIIKDAQEKKIKMASTNKFRFNQMLQAVQFADKTIADHLKKKDYTEADLDTIKSEDTEVKQSINIAKQMYGFGLSSLTQGITEIKKELKKADDLISEANLKTDYRKALGDNAQDFSTKYYGDNKTNPTVNEEAHGTHVSGIIGAVRNNGIGMNGVANHVKIMAVRTVPDGDEYDKDVALAIRYAVDNGAKVINTSFGKAYSPNKEWVYDAIKYAAEKDVLIVNAAGNDAKNIDVERTYPNDSKDLKTEIADNVITIGAMSSNYNENLPATFSNYGKNNVDIFAPGVQIYSTIPENEYEYFSGTSMAAPSTAGVAALIRSYYPKLTAKQVKHIIMNSGTKIGLEVIKPGSFSKEHPKGVKVPFSDLSVTGRIVNAYNALKMADRMVNGK